MALGATRTNRDRWLHRRSPFWGRVAATRPAITGYVDTRSAVAAACAAAGLLWLTLALVVVVGRAGHDLRRRRSRTTGRAARRLVRRARRHRTELGRWRRVGALVELARAHRRIARAPLYRSALAEPDPDVREAAVRALGLLVDTTPWAGPLLVETLRTGCVPRSRVAAQLEGVRGSGELVSGLIHDDDPAVRYWAAMLLARHPGTASAELAGLVDDADPGVRRAAIESLAERGERSVLPRILARLGDDVMYVRAHACRAAGALGGVTVAPQIVALLRDDAWWVRAAAKDVLRALGRGVAPLLIEALDVDDRFARNGAAEVLQDIGVVDDLLRTNPDAPLLARIFAAGEEGLQTAAHRRAASDEARVGTAGAREAA